MSSLGICIPILSRPISDEESRRLRMVFDALWRSLIRVSNRTNLFIRLSINGEPVQPQLLGLLREASGFIAQANCVRECIVRQTSEAGKIGVVNSTIGEATHWDGILVMDDDVIIPENGVPEAVAFIESRDGSRLAYSFPKCSVPMHDAATEFQRHMQLLYHPTTLRLLDSTGLFGARPSSSMYVLGRGRMNPFPNPCNEAEIFAVGPWRLSTSYCRTWYPPSVEYEVARRVRQHLQSVGSSTVNKNSQYLVDWHALERKLPVWVTERHRNRLRDALQLQRSAVLSAAQQLAPGGAPMKWTHLSRAKPGVGFPIPHESDATIVKYRRSNPE
jgi:hypothetical protein